MAIYYKTALRGDKNPNYKGGKVEKICETCGKIFYMLKAVKKITRFCSQKCCGKWKQGRLFPRKKYYCKKCGQELTRQEYGNKVYKRKYCDECSQSAKEKVFCKFCGRNFLGYRRGKRKLPVFCNELCMYKFYRGNGNPNWDGGISPLVKAIRRLPEYKQWREVVFERDIWTCQDCGQVGKKIHAHHIKKFAILFA